MPVIDFRFRPHTRETLETLSNSPIFRKGLLESGRDLEAFVAAAKTMEEIAEELRAAQMMRAVIVGRDAETTYQFKPNHEEIILFLEHYPDLFIGFAGVDPHKGMEALYQLEHLVKNHGFTGAAIDPMYAQIRSNHERYYPIYAKCCELDIPIIITTGLSPSSPGVTMDSAAPIYIDAVARDFPALQIILSHGGYPWVAETIGLAIRNPNVYLELSECEKQPLSSAYMEAANGPLKEKILFASAHPFFSYQDGIALYQTLPFTEEVREQIMWKNAARLLKIKETKESNADIEKVGF